MLRKDQILRLKQYAHGETDELPEKERALGLLCRALCIWRSHLRWVYFTARDVPPEEHQKSVPGAEEVDIALAEFVRTHPKLLENELVSEEAQHVLQQIRTPRASDSLQGEEALLSVLLSSMHPQEGEFLWRTCRAMNEEVVSRFFTDAYLRYHNSPDELSSRIYFGIQFYLRYLGPHRTKELLTSIPPLSPSMRDTLVSASAMVPSRFRTHVPPPPTLPDILPVDAELHTWSPDRITHELAEYRALCSDDFHKFLVANNFLAPYEVIGEVIARDVRTMTEAGLTRHQLANALRDVTLISEAQRLCLSPLARERGINFDYSPEQLRDVHALQERLHHLFGTRMNEETGEWEGNGPPFEVKMFSTFGHHPDPFHSEYPFASSRELGGTGDIIVTNRHTGETIRFGNMLPYLIRRACFFEGHVAYRLDPAKACRVMEPLLSRKQ